MKELKISDKISYIECSEDPLSADIGIIRMQDGIWLYDVGNDERSLAGLDGNYHIVLSHFHIDHVGNLGILHMGAENPGILSLYVSKETQKHIAMQGKLVEEDLYLDGLHIFPIRSSHAKGCLGLEVEETYAFVGDALYGRAKDGQYGYNAQLLRETIDTLKGLKASYLLMSHRQGLIRYKEEVISELERKWARREGNFVPG